MKNKQNSETRDYTLKLIQTTNFINLNVFVLCEKQKLLVLSCLSLTLRERKRERVINCGAQGAHANG